MLERPRVMPESLGENKPLGEILMEASVLVEQVRYLHSKRTADDPPLSTPHRLALEGMKLSVDDILKCRDCFVEDVLYRQIGMR